MRVAFVADVHVGNHKQHGGKLIAGMNERCTAVVDTMTRAIAVATEEHDVDLVVSLGDLFDTVRPEPQVITALQKAFAYHDSCGYGVLLGNHERVSELWGDHALGPLDHGPVRVYARSGALRIEADGDYIAMVPFQVGHAVDWIEQEIDAVVSSQENGGKCVALCLHLGMLDPSQTEPWAKAAEDAINVQVLADICSRYQIPRVFAGNWHTHQEWEFHYPLVGPGGFTVRITQVGALVPTGWDNPGLEGYGGVSLLGCDADRFEVPGPRFIEVHDKENLACVAALHSDQTLYVRAKVPPQHVSAAKAEVREVAEAADNVVAWEVVADQKVAQATARKAAVMARSQSTMRGVVEAYFGPLKLDVDKSKVQARVMGYLGMGDG